MEDRREAMVRDRERLNQGRRAARLAEVHYELYAGVRDKLERGEDQGDPALVARAWGSMRRHAVRSAGELARVDRVLCGLGLEYLPEPPAPPGRKPRRVRPPWLPDWRELEVEDPARVPHRVQYGDMEAAWSEVRDGFQALEEGAERYELSPQPVVVRRMQHGFAVCLGCRSASTGSKDHRLRRLVLRARPGDYDLAPFMVCL
jgi:hypothetical protein